MSTPAPTLSAVALDAARQRWDEAFGEMKDADVDRVMQLDPFRFIDEARFPQGLQLRDIIRFDTRLRIYNPGTVVVREGDFGNSAFFIIRGRVTVRLAGLVEGLRTEAPKASSEDTPEEVFESQRVFVQDLDAIIDGGDAPVLGAGQFFGEISAMGRTARTATVVATEQVEVLELRWQALRDIRRYSDAVRKHLDEIYRAHSLAVHLRATPIFDHLASAEIDAIAEQTVFETYGEFDWYGSYKQLTEADPNQRMAAEPLIVSEGDYPNGLVLIRSGFARVSQRIHSGHRTVKYLGRGGVFGIGELMQNWRSGTTLGWQTTLRAVGYVDILIVPTALVEKYVLPNLKDVSEFEPEGWLSMPSADISIDQAATEFMVENRFINGTAAMVIDLDRCTRCDDCVRACASTHGGIPRFERKGKQHDGMMVASACMHCTDPVCMIGCPTGAIHRKRTGEVVIDTPTCIGCATCANTCPYGNINIIPLRNEKGGIVYAEETMKPQMTASKCDLCKSSKAGPACVSACAHGALKRVDLSRFDYSGWTA